VANVIDDFSDAGFVGGVWLWAGAAEIELACMAQAKRTGIGYCRTTELVPVEGDRGFTRRTPVVQQHSMPGANGQGGDAPLLAEVWLAIEGKTSGAELNAESPACAMVDARWKYPAKLPRGVSVSIEPLLIGQQRRFVYCSTRRPGAKRKDVE